MPAEKVTTKAENRRSNKPLMEKRRRARINHSLSELKNLILDAIKKDSSRSSKLEKADILEMAVKHLQNLQKQQTMETKTGSKYWAGFNECAAEVTRFLETAEGIDAAVRSRLVNHLFNCLNKLCSAEHSDNVQNSADSTSKSDGVADTVSSEVGTSNQNSPTSTDHSATMVSNGRSEATTTIVHGLQLIPTRLSNGELAFVLPNQSFRPSTERLPDQTSSPPLTLSASLPDRGACLLMPAASHVTSSADSSLSGLVTDSCSGSPCRPMAPAVTTTACQTSPPEDTRPEERVQASHVQDRSHVDRESPPPQRIAKDCTECVWRPW